MTKISILFITIAIFFSCQTFGQGIVFNNGSWESNLQKAKSENKLIMLDAYASWCGPCKAMDKKTFTDAEVGTFFNENFVCVKMDMEKGKGPMLQKKYKLTAYPTIYFIDGKGKKVHENKGYLNPTEFLELGKEALGKYVPKRNKDKDKEKKDNDNVEVTKLLDKRDANSYKTVKIGHYVWMAENLNYETKKGSVCYENKAENCEKYGRLYTYNAALNACPQGWHLATTEEWSDLEEYSGGADNLKEINGFAALPAGILSGSDMEAAGDDVFLNIDVLSAFWANTQKKNDRKGAYYYMWTDDSKINYDTGNFSTEKNSVRCVKN